MALKEDIAWVGQFLDAYGAREPQMGVASTRPTDSGVPVAMQAGPVDAHGWVEWRVMPSTLTEAEVGAVEKKFSTEFPPLFRAYLLARFQMFDQVNSPRYDQLVCLSDTPAGKPLAHLLRLLSTWGPLTVAGFIPFAEWGDGWGPMCFDTGRRAADGDCPVVWMEHEILGPMRQEQWRDRRKMLPLAEPLYASCRDMLLDLFGDAPAKSLAEDEDEPPKAPVREGWAARIAKLFRREG